MKLLVVLANYGVKNDVFLRRVVEEYRSLPYQVHIVVLASCEKLVEGASEIIVHRPKGDPLEFPFAHRAILAERAGDFDLFIYSEDDTLIAQDNIEAFLEADRVLTDNEIAGFLRYERTPEGRVTVSTINGHFRWDPSSVVERGQQTFAHFSNEHSACYLLTSAQLRRAIQSGGYLVSPHQGKYQLLETAATDPYTQCGFRKLICISQIHRFLIHHLPNKYVDRFGVAMEELERQIEALDQIRAGARLPSVLMCSETRLRHQPWSKCIYEPLDFDVANLVAATAGTVLSFGCGSGVMESELKSRGLAVTAVPLDGVIGACVEGRGIETVYGDIGSIWRSIDGRRFDCVLIHNLLHIAPNPPQLLMRLAGTLSAKGIIVAAVPNVLQARTFWRGARGLLCLSELLDYSFAGVHPVWFWQIRRWFASAGLRLEHLTPRLAADSKRWQRLAGRLLPPVFADDYVAVGRANAAGNSSDC